MSATLRAVADAYRLGRIPDLTGVTPGGLHDLGDAILAGGEALELVDAIEWEVFEAAGLDDSNVGDTAISLAKAWELVAERIGALEHQADAVRAALVKTGSLDASDTTTDIAALITVLFAT